MSFEKTVPLNEYITLKRGFDLPKGDRIVGEIPVIASTGVGGYHNETKVEAPGVVIGRSGSIGGGQYITEDFWPLNTTLWVKDFKGHHPRYVYYLLRSIDFQQFNVGTGVPTLNRNHLDCVLVADIGYQNEKRIAEIIGDLDDKIELNRQTNQTLEAIAQAIFKSWFVDFEPTRAKLKAKQNGQDPERAAMAVISGKTVEQLDQLSPEQQQQLKTTATLFPDALEDSELGEIPEGWECRKFADVAKCFDSQRIPLSKKEREEKKPGDIPYYGATSIMDYVNEWLFDDIYLLLGEDGSVINEDGTPFIQYIWGQSWVNNHAHVMQGINGVSTEQLMLFMKNQNISAYITGAVQLKLNQRNMNSIPFLDAGEELNTVFYKLIQSSYEKIRETVEENQCLTELRDTLLPKLLSGELTAPEAKSRHEEVLA